MNKPILYTTKEAMEILKVSRTTLYRIVSAGQLKPIKVGGSNRYREEEINRYLEEMKKA